MDLEAVNSRASAIEQCIETRKTEHDKLHMDLEELRRLNDEAHRQLTQQAEIAAAKVAGGAQVINHVRELVRFFKEA